ncbi:MAG: T9SS type A sorting domain-containing protein [Bacteroidota bacterium]|jgi:Secretion system C-terminal sorting domain
MNDMKSSRLLFVLFFCGCLIPAVSAQQDMFTKVFVQSAGWVQTYGMTRTPANNYILTGYRQQMPMAMMISESGSIIWAKTYDTVYGNLYCAANTADGNILLAGSLGRQQSGNHNDVLLIKVTTTGDTLWAKKLDMGYDETPLSLKPTTDGGFILGGFSYADTPPYFRSFVAKIDAAGNLQWGKTFYSGNFGNYAYTATETPDGGYLVSGSVAASTNYYESLLLLKLSSAGAVVWAEQYPDIPSRSTVAYDAVIVNGNAVCYFIDESQQMGLMKVDMYGAVLWCKALDYNGYYQYLKPGPKLHQCADGGFAFVNGSDSYFGPIGELIRTDSTAEVTWSRELLLLTIDVSPTSSGGFLACGNGPIMGVTESSTDNPQIGTIKLNSQGASYGCVQGKSAAAVPFSPGLIPATLNEATAGTISWTHCVLQDVVMGTDSGCITVTGGVAEKRGLEPLRIVPNPSGGKVKLESGLDPEVTFSSLEVYNSLGKAVFQQTKSRSGIRDANLEFLPNGLYLLKAVSGGKTYAGKLLIAH